MRPQVNRKRLPGKGNGEGEGESWGEGRGGGERGEEEKEGKKKLREPHMERKGRAGEGDRSCLPGGFELEWGVLAVGVEGGRLPPGGV